MNARSSVSTSIPAFHTGNARPHAACVCLAVCRQCRACSTAPPVLQAPSPMTPVSRPVLGVPSQAATSAGCCVCLNDLIHAHEFAWSLSIHVSKPPSSQTPSLVLVEIWFFLIAHWSELSLCILLLSLFYGRAGFAHPLTHYVFGFLISRGARH